MRIVMQVIGQVMDQCMKVFTSVMERLLNSVNKLRVSITQASLNVVNLFNQLVSHAQKAKVLLVNLTTQVLSIKLAVTLALTKIWDLGLQLVTIARQTLQLVITAFKKNKGHVDKTK
jgi:hypothetical protein